MPERKIDEAIRRLDDGVVELQALVTQVERLDRSRRWLQALILAIALGAASVLALLAYVIVSNNNDRVAACRSSNDRFDRLFDFLELNIERDDGHTLIDGMRVSAIIDCDDDGTLDDDISTTPTTQE